MRRLALAITGMELPAIEKISDAQAEDAVPGADRHAALGAHPGRHDARGIGTRLFKRARTPRTMARLTVDEIEQLIYPVSFYRNKARFVKATAETLATRFGGRVPRTMEELTALPGVGRKTANLVLILAFKSEHNICVDTHVHRISNRLGWVQRDLPERDGTGAVPSHRPAMVALHQPLSRDLGAERLSSRLPAVRRLCHPRYVPQDWRPQGGQGEMNAHAVIRQGWRCSSR